VETAPFRRQDLADVEVAAALDGVADRCVQRREGFGDLPVMVQECGLGINVNSRPDLSRDLGSRDVLAIQLTVSIVAEIHRAAIVTTVERPAISSPTQAAIACGTARQSPQSGD